MVIISNNPLMKDVSGTNIKVIYKKISMLDLLKESLEFSYEGYTLLNHPLHANWQMNQTPYKTLLFEHKKIREYNTTFYLNQSIEWAANLACSRQLPEKWPHNCLRDLQEIDKENVLNYLD
ncbi:MAG: GrdX family protein [Bacillota bacterium]|nr:GrdX family protein [Bacillota bacterium]